MNTTVTDAEILELALVMPTQRAIAEALGISTPRVSKVLREHGRKTAKIPKAPKMRPARRLRKKRVTKSKTGRRRFAPDSERNQEILLLLLDQKLNHGEIAKKFGVTRQRVSQLAAEYGVAARRGRPPTTEGKR